MLKDPRTIDFILNEAISLEFGLDASQVKTELDLLSMRNKIEQSEEVYNRASIYLFGSSQKAEENKAKLHNSLNNLFSVRSQNA